MGLFLLRGRSSEPLRETQSPFSNSQKGCQFLDAALGPAFGATSQALHAACHKDFLRSLNVKSTLSIGKNNK